LACRYALWKSASPGTLCRASVCADAPFPAGKGLWRGTGEASLARTVRKT